MKNANTGLSNTQPSDVIVVITDALTTHAECRGIFIGTTQSLDLYVMTDATGTYAWVPFVGATAGTVLPVMAKGARKTSGSAAPDSGDVLFLY